MTFLSTVDIVNPSYKAGIAAYYYHWTKPQSEIGELSLTSDMTLIVKLKMKRTKVDLIRWLQAHCKLIASWLCLLKSIKLLGKPYIHCSKEPDANFCANKNTELDIIQKCNCYYGHITNGIELIDTIKRSGIRIVILSPLRIVRLGSRYQDHWNSQRKGLHLYWYGFMW